MYNTFNVVKVTSEFRQDQFWRIREGCTLDNGDIHSEILMTFHDEAAAKEELRKAKYDPQCRVCSYVWKTAGITEYMIESCSCDDDGEFIEGSDFEPARKFHFSSEDEKIILD